MKREPWEPFVTKVDDDYYVNGIKVDRQDEDYYYQGVKVEFLDGYFYAAGKVITENLPRGISEVRNYHMVGADNNMLLAKVYSILAESLAKERPEYRDLARRFNDFAENGPPRA